MVLNYLDLSILGALVPKSARSWFFGKHCCHAGALWRALGRIQGPARRRRPAISLLHSPRFGDAVVPRQDRQDLLQILDRPMAPAHRGEPAWASLAWPRRRPRRWAGAAWENRHSGRRAGCADRESRQAPPRSASSRGRIGARPSPRRSGDAAGTGCRGSWRLSLASPVSLAGSGGAGTARAPTICGNIWPFRRRRRARAIAKAAQPTVASKPGRMGGDVNGAGRFRQAADRAGHRPAGRRRHLQRAFELRIRHRRGDLRHPARPPGALVRVSRRGRASRRHPRRGRHPGERPWRPGGTRSRRISSSCRVGQTRPYRPRAGWPKPSPRPMPEAHSRCRSARALSSLPRPASSTGARPRPIGAAPRSSPSAIRGSRSCRTRSMSMRAAS